MPRVFYVSLKVGQREFIGEGHNRQEARNDAASKALNILKKLPLPNEDAAKKPEPEKQETSKTISWLDRNKGCLPLHDICAPLPFQSGYVSLFKVS